MSKEINLEKIWQKVLNSYDMYIDYDLRGHDAILTAMKVACGEVLDLATETAYIEYIDLTSDESFNYTDVLTNDNVAAQINKNSILQIKDWVKQK